MTSHAAPPSTWTGQLVLELRNGRDWAAGTLEIQVRREMLEVRYQGLLIAAPDRDRFRRWLHHPQGPWLVDDTRWTRRRYHLELLIRQRSWFLVDTESLASLLVVI